MEEEIKQETNNSPKTEVKQTEAKAPQEKPEEKPVEITKKEKPKKEAPKKEPKVVRASHKKKEQTVQKLTEQIKKAKTLMIVDIKGLPSPQFQKIKKTIREHAAVIVAKKNILNRVIKALGKESSLPLEKNISENCAFAISDLEGFELAGILARNKTPIYAKAGQEAPDDIEVKAGPTSLIPGPAISELGALGIKIAVEEGKISIREPKVIVKKGETLKAGAVSILQKLDIKPFEIGLEPIALYDIQNEKIYANIKINPAETIEELRAAAGKALGLAQKIVYYCKDTIGYLLAKANSEGGALEKLQPKVEEKKEAPAPKPEEKKEEAPKEEPKEITKEETNNSQKTEEKTTEAEAPQAKLVEITKEKEPETQIKSKEESK